MIRIGRCTGQDGFTLVELLVVGVILSILTTVIAGAITVADTVAARGTGGPTRLSQVGGLVELAGPSVLLFGAGFWYAVELHQPGRLDAFRLGHFLLLAATYSLFFVIFGVLGAQEVPSWLAIAIAATIALPLLIAHVATIVNLRFALRSALPLSLMTMGLVVNHVYGDTAKSFVYLGVACVVVAFVTLSYPQLVRGHESRRLRLEAQLDDALAGMTKEALTTRQTIANSKALLAVQDPEQLEALREWVERRTDHASRLLVDCESACSIHAEMICATQRMPRANLRRNATKIVDQLHNHLPQVRTAVEQAMQALASHRQQRRSEPQTSGTHCMACGQPGDAEGQFCAACGTPTPERRQCQRCDTVLPLPRHLLAAVNRKQTPPVTHCCSCGERHAG